MSCTVVLGWQGLRIFWAESSQRPGSGLGLLACFCFAGSIFVGFEIVSHCISSWPRTCYVDQTGFELWDLSASEHCS